MERYENEPYLSAIEVLALESGAGEPGAPAPFYVELAETVLFPGGGGQPADRGTLAGQPIAAAEKREEGRWRFYLPEPVDSSAGLELKLDWSRRFDLMQQHTAQHLLSAIALDRFGWRTTAFHLGEELTDIELDAAELPAEKLAALEALVAEAIRAAVPVRTRRVEQEEYEKLEGVRSRGLPAGHQGSVRLVEIEGIDLNTCGGTHLRSTAEIESLKLLHTEPMRGGTRLYWVAGGRVRSRLAAAEARNARLRRLLDTGDGELVAVLESRLEQLAEAKRAKERIEARLAEAEAAAFGDRPFADRHYEDGNLAFLQKLARGWQGGAGSGLLFATAGKGKDAAFLIATRGEMARDIKSLGQGVAAKLEGKGGGAGRLFQGKAAGLEKRGEAVAILAAAAEPGA
jgi:Ser-tRNA(Ala) deacylase AlaX